MGQYFKEKQSDWNGTNLEGFTIHISLFGGQKKNVESHSSGKQSIQQELRDVFILSHVEALYVILLAMKYFWKV